MLKILDPCTLKTLNPPTGMVNQDYMGLLFGHASFRDNARATWGFKQQQKRNDRFSFQFYRLHAKISMRKIDGHFLRYFFWCNFSESAHKETIITDYIRNTWASAWLSASAEMPYSSLLNLLQTFKCIVKKLFRNA